MEVTAKNAKTLPPGRYGIGDGLRLHVTDATRRYWVFRYSQNGKRRDKSLGSAMLIPLSAAKARARELRVALAQGIDLSAVEEEKVCPTFAEITPEAIANFQRVRRWRNEKHSAQWQSTMETYAFPILGEMRVNQIERDDVLTVLRPIWETKTETASRVRGRIEAILSYAAAKGLRSGANPAAWKSNLDAFLPQESSIKEERHHKAISLPNLKAAAPRLFASSHVSVRAVIFGILTATRAQEVIGATWDEVDFDAKTWTISPDRMKTGVLHRVPLSDQAMDILLRQRENAKPGQALIFPSTITGSKLAVDSLRQGLRVAAHTDATMHGCRSTFRDWCEENLIHNSLSEKALSHVSSSKVVRAYQRSDLLEQRRPVMQQWADFLLK